MSTGLQTVYQDEPNSGLACLVLWLRLNGLSADEQHLARSIGANGPLTAEELVRCAGQMGLDASLVTCKLRELAAQMNPVIAETNDGGFVVVLGSNRKHVSLQDPQDSAPVSIRRREFARRWTGRAIVLTPQSESDEAPRNFGFAALWSVFSRYRVLFVEVLLASFFVQLLSLASPLVFLVVIDKVIVHRGVSTLDVLVSGFVLVILCESLLTGLRNHTIARSVNRLDTKLTVEMVRHVLGLPLEYFNQRKVGDTITRIDEIRRIRTLISDAAVFVIVDLFFVFLYFALMYYFSSLLFTIVLISLPLYGLSFAFITPVLRRRYREQFDRHKDTESGLIEAISGIGTVKSLAAEPQFFRRAERHIAAYAQAIFRTDDVQTVVDIYNDVVSKLTIAALIWFGAQLVIVGSLTLGQLIAFNLLNMRLLQPILRLARVWRNLLEVRVAIERVGEVFDAKPEVTLRRTLITRPRLVGEICLRSVSFAYDQRNTDVLKGISLEIPAGEVIGLVGRSGSGKSTLLTLLQGLYLPTAGQILIDEVDIRLLDPFWLRRQIGVVPQDVYLFDRSIRENIAIADPDTPMERVMEVAKLTGAHEFVLDLPRGYDTEIGERGTILSGGQRQRIALARALVTDPAILLLDEPTSSLDQETEQVIQQNLREIVHNRTVVVSSHKAAALDMADRIITLGNGSIVADGDPAQLPSQSRPVSHASSGRIWEV